MKLAIFALALLAACVIITAAYVAQQPPTLSAVETGSCIIIDGDTATSLTECRRWR